MLKEIFVKIHLQLPVSSLSSDSKMKKQMDSFQNFRVKL